MARKIEEYGGGGGGYFDWMRPYSSNLTESAITTKRKEDLAAATKKDKKSTGIDLVESADLEPTKTNYGATKKELAATKKAADTIADRQKPAFKDAGRWVFNIPAGWADRVGGTRGTPQEVNVKADNFNKAAKQLIKFGIPSAVVNGFDARVSKTGPTTPTGEKSKTKGNIIYLEEQEAKKGVSAVTAGGGGSPYSNVPNLTAIATEGGTSAEDKLVGMTMGDDSKRLIKALESMGKLNVGNVVDGKVDPNAANDFGNTLTSYGGSGGLNMEGDGKILDPNLKSVTQDKIQKADPDDDEAKSNAENEILKRTGISGVTADLSAGEASMVAALLSGDLSADDIATILDDPEFNALIDDPSREFYNTYGPQLNPFLKLALDQAVKKDAAAQGIKLENIRGDFLLDQAEVEALGGLTQFQAGKIRGDAAVSGATGFGAMLAADSAPRRDDIKNLAAMQASGGFDDVEDMKEALRLQASGGLSDEENILSTRQAQAATNPWAAMRMGGLLDAEDPYKTQQNINTALRGGLTPTQQKDLAAAPAFAAGNPYEMTAQQNIDLLNQQARGGLQEAQDLDPYQLAREGQRQRMGLGIEQYMESLRGGLSPEERQAEIRNTGYWNATRPAELQAAASGPYGYMQQQLGTGLNEQQRANILGEVGQMQRGGLSVEQRLAEIQAQGAPQQLSSYLNFIGNPSAVAAAQQGGFSPFGDFAQRTADSPAGTVPQEFAGLGNIGVGAPASTPFATPQEFTGLSGTSDYAGGLEQDATMADWDKLSGNQGQAALGEWAMQGTAPDEAERKIKSVTPMSTNEYGRSPRRQYGIQGD